MLDWLINFVNEYLVSFALKLVAAAAVLLVGLKLVKLLSKKISGGKAVAKLDSNVGSLVVSSLKLVLNALIIIIAVEILGVPSATIIAAIGSCGLAIGLALQGGLSNIAGGVMILVFKPFHIGDYITTPVGEGTVEEIGLFYTRLVTVDSRSVNIPNSVLSSSTVTNLSCKPIRGIDIDVDVSYSTDIEKAKGVLLKCAEDCPEVLAEPAPKSFVSAHKDSSVCLTLRVCVESANYWNARFELLQTTVEKIRAAGIEIPFPQVDVHMKQ